ncbi:glutamate receptor 2.2-like [Durio zibethinus]|uniref:Glutamate receptor 2.2-like n=1 Tax=Durio zibethinus TaxID=66656 RepID=A0A6P6A1H4_DURZI|nr:glutamate receptor 2.2-like [Durio zibethinus]XP_022758813.1 glutamate receptor 2.2-like [Durio zibethinus]XP_022758814.1 glutamate receptor 2.2-like [Durio zibethinus]XP_022758815.1 glutamate receptor 2.2-like [Durio zibethinus]XP_022758816.1 glutamate receptor 2.2-like [Durio zibethinus]XP_022758817.1 glutamate receptor 2.2-like [Durio zibethinus]XP_022758819.1 glutamate receptor 2.2-like [Durio zibethinus]XP_022758820.1 glutamate receptor 2.2-like [Durio zibethinus]XP_022758821.1 glut
MSLQTAVYMVHMSPSLASRCFLNAKQLEMISLGSAWIATDMIMNFLHSMEPSFIESMQGVVGFKPYIPTSKELRNFTIRWRSKNFIKTKNSQEMELNVYGIWTYDMVWALATAAEKVKAGHPDIIHQETRLIMNFTTILSSESGLLFIDEILQTRFKGISGGFQLANGRLIPKEFEIVNVFKGERIGYWTPGNGITKITKQDNRYEMNSTSSSKLEAVIWPGGNMNIPKGWSLCGKKLRIAVPMKNGRFSELINVTFDPQTNVTTVSGFSVDVFKTAIETSDYEVKYEFIPFENASGSAARYYSDLIHHVYLKNYLAVVGDTTITAGIFSEVDFTLPYTDLGVGMVVRKTNKNSMWIFLKPLAGNLWITTAAFFIFTGFVVWLIEHPINDEFRGPPAQQIGTIFGSPSQLLYLPKARSS